MPLLLETARAWAADDPDADTRAEIEELVAQAESGSSSAHERLARMFSGSLAFGTAGLRAPMGAGPLRINRKVVMRATAGIASHLRSTGGHSVIVGYDARRQSSQFARDAAAVLAGAGLEVSVLPHPVPTPVLAFTVRQLEADAGIMVTASHNPAVDNGLKVYLKSGAQLTSPVDAQIAACIDAVNSLESLPLADDWITLDDDVIDDYVSVAASVVSDQAPRDVLIAHTALHGVGGQVFLSAGQRAGFTRIESCPEQFAPDGTFPTVEHPNPEEPGAMALVLALAEQVGAQLAIAHDPDADRCAVAVPDRTGNGFRRLTGDEVGWLLAWWTLERSRRGWSAAVTGTFATTIVSSSLLSLLAEDAGLGYAQTLTGFKWIAAVPDLAFGYEEALGYCVDPRHVLDKDGITAALRMCELVATLAVSGESVHDVLDSLAGRYGVHVTEHITVRVGDISEVAPIVVHLLASAPSMLGAFTVTEVVDLSQGWLHLPPTDGIRIAAASGDAVARVVVRPSGTEPKLKGYVEVVLPRDADVGPARDRATALAADLAADVAGALRQILG